MYSRFFFSVSKSFLLYGLLLSFLFFVSKVSAAAAPKDINAIINECKDSLKKAKQETTGMDMESYALMTQVSGQVAQTAEGASALIAHQGSAALSGALSAITLKRCTQCKSAIKSCKEEECNVEKRCINISKCNCKEPLETNPECANICSDCNEELEATTEECVELETPCEQACIQATVSALQAATSLLASMQLSGCEGEDCDTNSSVQSQTENINLPTGATPGILESQVGNMDTYSNPKTKEAISAVKLTPKTPNTANKNKGYNTKNSNPKPTSSNFQAVGSGDPLEQDSSTSSFLGDAMSPSSEEATPVSDLEDKKEHLKEDGSLKNIDFGSFSASTDSNFGGNNYRRQRQVRKVARNTKDRNALKRKTPKPDTLGVGKSDNIFIKMSHFIEKVCHGKEKQCY